MLLKSGQLMLFQGDSITDCGRSREDLSDLGAGYPSMVAAALTARWPAMGLRFVNRGISGNRAADLEARWTQDAVVLQPDVVSILIGINDTWRRYDRGDPTAAEAYGEHYDAILRRTRKETGARLIILEPFVLPVPPDRLAWREDLDPKIAVARRLAAEHKALFIPLDGLFAAAGIAATPGAFARDGVHPTAAGHALIAQALISALENG